MSYPFLSVEPMLPTLVRAPFSNPDWIFEPKWDGFRAICYMRDGEVRFVSRRRNDLTAKFPELQSIAESVKARSAVLDGEIVALDENGMPCFDALRSPKSSGGCVIVSGIQLSRTYRSNFWVSASATVSSPVLC